MRVRLTEKEVDKYCLHNNIKRLESFKTQQTSQVWLCLLHNKEFKTNFKNIKTRKSGCAECQRIKRIKTFEDIGKKLTINDCHREAAKNNGRCLSTEYVNLNSRLEWQCGACGYIWRASFSSIKHKNSWCPKCRANNYTENQVRDIFEHIFNKPFPTARLSFLKNPSTGRNLELDGYCKELGLAFEYDGRFHYEERSSQELTQKQIKRHGNLEATQERDKLKDELCKKANIRLIRVPYWERDNLDHYIRKAIKDLHALQEIKS